MGWNSSFGSYSALCTPAAAPAILEKIRPAGAPWQWLGVGGSSSAVARMYLRPTGLRSFLGETRSHPLWPLALAAWKQVCLPLYSLRIVAFAVIPLPIFPACPFAIIVFKV